MDRHLLFFYGTLMSRQGRGNVLTNRVTTEGVALDLAVPVAHGTIRGQMFDAGGGSFPAILDGDGVVHGEVWEAPTEAHLRAALAITDSIEGYRGPGVPGNLYERIEAPLLSVGGDAGLWPGLTVLTYRWADERRYLGPRIESGDWRTYERAGRTWSAA